MQYLLLLRSNGVNSSNRRLLLSPLLTQCYYYSLNPFFSNTTQKKNPCPQISSDMADFLETSCGFSAKKAVEILNRRTSSRLRAPLSIEKAKTVVHVLRDIGFEDAHIRKIVNNYPRFLVCKVEKTLIPKIRILQDLGLTGPSIGKLMSRSSAILTQPLPRTIEFLRKVLNNDEEVIRCLRDLSYCNYNIIQTRVERNIEVLRNSVMVPFDLGGLMCRFPMIFMGKPEFLDDCIGRAKHMGFDCREKMFVEALGVICHVSRTWEKKIEMWKSYGWEEEDIVRGFRRHPRCMLVSESKLAKALKFFMVELKHSPAELATRSEVFAASIEKKILPRYAVFKKLQSEGIMWKSNTKTFFTIMGMKELHFRRNVLSYLEDAFPDDYQAYLKTVGNAIQSMR